MSKTATCVCCLSDSETWDMSQVKVGRALAWVCMDAECQDKMPDLTEDDVVTQIAFGGAGPKQQDFAREMFRGQAKS